MSSPSKDSRKPTGAVPKTLPGHNADSDNDIPKEDSSQRNNSPIIPMCPENELQDCFVESNSEKIKGKTTENNDYKNSASENFICKQYCEYSCNGNQELVNPDQTSSNTQQLDPCSQEQNQNQEQEHSSYSQFVADIQKKFPCLNNSVDSKISVSQKITLQKLSFVLQVLPTSKGIKTDDTMVKEANNNDIIVNSTSLEDVALSETNSLSRAQSVTSIESASRVLSPTEIQLLEARLSVSNNNIREIKQKQQELLKMQQTVSSFLEDLESSRVNHTSSDMPPNFQSVEEIQNHMANLIKRMKHLKVFVQRQAEFSASLGEDGIDLVAEQNDIIKQWEGIFDRQSEMENLISDLHEAENVNNNVSTENDAAKELENHSVANDLQRNVPIELVGAQASNASPPKEHTDEKLQSEMDDEMVLEIIDEKIDDVNAVRNELIELKLLLRRRFLDYDRHALSQCLHAINVGRNKPLINAGASNSMVSNASQLKDAAQSEKIRSLSKMTEELRNQACLTRQNPPKPNERDAPKADNNITKISMRTENPVESNTFFNRIQQSAPSAAHLLASNFSWVRSNARREQSENPHSNSVTPNNNTPTAIACDCPLHSPYVTHSNQLPRTNSSNISAFRQVFENQPMIINSLNHTQHIVSAQQEDITTLFEEVSELHESLVAIRHSLERPNTQLEDSVPLNCVQNNLCSGLTGIQSGQHHSIPIEQLPPPISMQPTSSKFNPFYNNHSDHRQTAHNNGNHSSMGDVRQSGQFVRIVPTQLQNRPARTPTPSEFLYNENHSSSAGYYPSMQSFRRHRNIDCQSNNHSNLVNDHQKRQHQHQQNQQNQQNQQPQQHQLKIQPSFAKPNQVITENVSSALNNQVPPGNRTNNYWDNFRSYSTQNLLSSGSHKNESQNHQISGQQIQSGFDLNFRNSTVSNNNSPIQSTNGFSQNIQRQYPCMERNENRLQPLNCHNNLVNNRPINMDARIQDDLNDININKSDVFVSRRMRNASNCYETIFYNPGQIRHNSNINFSCHDQNKLPTKTTCNTNTNSSQSHPNQLKTKSNHKQTPIYFSPCSPNHPAPSNTMPLSTTNPFFTPLHPMDSHQNRNILSDAARRSCSNVFLGQQSLRNDNLANGGNNENVPFDYGEGACGFRRTSELPSTELKRNLLTNSSRNDIAISERAKDSNTAKEYKHSKKLRNQNEFSDPNNFESYMRNNEHYNGSNKSSRDRTSEKLLPLFKNTGDLAWVNSNVRSAQSDVMRLIMTRVREEIYEEPITNSIKIRIAELTAYIIHKDSLKLHKQRVNSAKRIYTDMIQQNCPNTHEAFLNWYKEYLEQVIAFRSTPDDLLNVNWGFEPLHLQTSNPTNRYSSGSIPTTPNFEITELKRERHVSYPDLKDNNQNLNPIASKNSNNIPYVNSFTSTDTSEASLAQSKSDGISILLVKVSERLVSENDVKSSEGEGDISHSSSSGNIPLPVLPEHETENVGRNTIQDSNNDLIQHADHISEPNPDQESSGIPFSYFDHTSKETK